MTRIFVHTPRIRRGYIKVLNTTYLRLTYCSFHKKSKIMVQKCNDFSINTNNNPCLMGSLTLASVCSNIFSDCSSVLYVFDNT